MKLELDTALFEGWVATHLQWVISIALLAVSWLAATRCTYSHDFLAFWWGILSLGFGFGGFIYLGNTLVAFYDRLDTARKK